MALEHFFKVSAAISLYEATKTVCAKESAKKHFFYFPAPVSGSRSQKNGTLGSEAGAAVENFENPGPAAEPEPTKSRLPDNSGLKDYRRTSFDTSSTNFSLG